MRSPEIYPLLVKEWVFRLLFSDSRPLRIWNLEHFHDGKCSVDSFKGSYRAKIQITAAHKHKPEERSSYILLCADSFMGRQALILINVRKEKLLPWSEGWIFFFFFFCREAPPSYSWQSWTKANQSKAILNTSAVQKINLNKAPTIPPTSPTGAIRVSRPAHGNSFHEYSASGRSRLL